MTFSRSLHRPPASGAIANNRQRKSVNNQVVTSVREIPLTNLLSLLHTLLSYSSCRDSPMDFWMYWTSTSRGSVCICCRVHRPTGCLLRVCNYISISLSDSRLICQLNGGSRVITEDRLLWSSFSCRTGFCTSRYELWAGVVSLRCLRIWNEARGSCVTVS